MIVDAMRIVLEFHGPEMQLHKKGENDGSNCNRYRLEYSDCLLLVIAIMRFVNYIPFYDF